MERNSFSYVCINTSKVSLYADATLMGGIAMGHRRKTKKDRSGASTLLAAAVVIVVTAVIATGAFIFLSDSDDEEILAPGTVMRYDITMGGNSYVSDIKIVGQNADEYFIMTNVVGGTSSFTYYELIPKGIPKEAEKAGSAEMETIYGLKTVDIWEHTYESLGITTVTKQYVDPSNYHLTYKYELTTVPWGAEVHTLIEYDPVWQKAYKESGSIGTKYEYSGVSPTTTYSITIECVADCLDGQYGISYGNGVFFLSGSPQGLPADAVYTGRDGALSNTIDGDVLVQIWVHNSAEYYRGYNSGIIYRISYLNESEAIVNLELVKKTG